MLYYLHLYSHVWFPLNLFRYITFRIGGAALTSLILALVIGPPVIAWLRRKKIGQVQRKDGPQTHLTKEGTPTMGGLMIFVSLVASVLLWARLDNPYVLGLLAVTLILFAVGWYDDFVKLIQRDPRGISSRAKLAVQVLAALLVAGIVAVLPPNAAYLTRISIPYTPMVTVDLRTWYYVFAMLVIVGSSNAVNLTDGLDGLAAGSLVITAVAFLFLAYAAGHAKISGYLNIIPVPLAGEISVFLGAMIGGCLGFLWFNAYPAEVFMGDTSSLFLGGVLGTVALFVKQELLLPIAGGLFVLETLSVLIQVASYRLRGKKRVFLMAPLHHHFELKGWAEPKVTVRFWILSIIFMMLTLASLKIG